MFGMIAAYAVVPYMETSILLSGDIQQEVEEQVQQELSGEVSDEIQEEIEQQMLQEIQETMVHNGYASDSVIQNYVNYAYSIGGSDFVKLIECENGRWDPNRVSKTHDYGLCQLNYKYNKNFINSPDFTDPYKQLDYCYEKYKANPKLRYGPNRKIEGKRCSDYVSSRFGILVTYNNKISENIN